MIQLKKRRDYMKKLLIVALMASSFLFSNVTEAKTLGTSRDFQVESRFECYSIGLARICIFVTDADELEEIGKVGTVAFEIINGSGGGPKELEDQR